MAANRSTGTTCPRSRSRRTALRAMCRGPRSSAGSPQLIQRDEFFTEQEQDNFENIDPVEIRERLAQRGIVDGKVVDPEKLDSDPVFVRSGLMWNGLPEGMSRRLTPARRVTSIILETP